MRLIPLLVSTLLAGNAYAQTMVAPTTEAYNGKSLATVMGDFGTPHHVTEKKTKKKLTRDFYWNAEGSDCVLAFYDGALQLPVFIRQPSYLDPESGLMPPDFAKPAERSPVCQLVFTFLYQPEVSTNAWERWVVKEVLEKPAFVEPAESDE